MDISSALLAKSDQLNAADLSGAPIVVTIKSARQPGGQGTPVFVDLVGMEGRPWKPSKGMLRVLAAAWGTETDVWHGRLVKLVSNPDVLFKGKPVGGVEVVAMSHIERPFTVPKRVNQTNTIQHHVDVLAEPVTEPWIAQWQAIRNALTEAGYEGGSPELLATAGQVIGATWTHPNQINAEDAQKILAAVRENNQEENN